MALSSKSDVGELEYRFLFVRPQTKIVDHGSVSFEEYQRVQRMIGKDKKLIAKIILGWVYVLVRLSFDVLFKFSGCVMGFILFMAVMMPDTFLYLMHSLATLTKAQLSIWTNTILLGAGVFYFMVLACTEIKSLGYVDYKEQAIKTEFMKRFGIYPSEENISFFCIVPSNVKKEKQITTKLRIVE